MNDSERIQAKPPPRLRARAEATVHASHRDLERICAADVHAALHELQIRESELALQNEELRQTQAELAQARDRFSDLCDFAPVGYVTLDPAGTVLEANLTAATMLAVTCPELVGQSHIVLFDVTERQRAEEGLKQNEEQYRLLIDANPKSMWVFDEETLRFLAVNHAALRLYGWSKEQFLRLTVKNICPHEEVPRVPAMLRRLKTTDAAFAGEWRHCKKNGKVFDVRATLSAIQFKGRAARLGMVHDISDYKRQETELKQLNATPKKRVAARTVKTALPKPAAKETA